MMNGREKSDPAIVAAKQANKAGEPAAELVERRAGAKGKAIQHHAFRTQRRGLTRHRRWSAYGEGKRWPSLTRGRSRMRESRKYGSVRGAGSNARPYRDRPWSGR